MTYLRRQLDNLDKLNETNEIENHLNILYKQYILCITEDIFKNTPLINTIEFINNESKVILKNKEGNILEENSSSEKLSNLLNNELVEWLNIKELNKQYRYQTYKRLSKKWIGFDRVLASWKDNVQINEQFFTIQDFNVPLYINSSHFYERVMENQLKLIIKEVDEIKSSYHQQEFLMAVLHLMNIYNLQEVKISIIKDEIGSEHFNIFSDNLFVETSLIDGLKMFLHPRYKKSITERLEDNEIVINSNTMEFGSDEITNVFNFLPDNFILSEIKFELFAERERKELKDMFDAIRMKKKLKS